MEKKKCFDVDVVLSRRSERKKRKRIGFLTSVEKKIFSFGEREEFSFSIPKEGSMASVETLASFSFIRNKFVRVAKW